MFINFVHLISDRYVVQKAILEIFLYKYSKHK